jgi:hypothetical protein
MTRTFDGLEKRQDAINKLRDCLPENPPSVWVILLTPPEYAAYEVAAVSAKEKVKAFKEANVQVAFIDNDNWQSLGPSSIEGVLASSTLKIVQQPLPRVISNLQIKI